MKHILTIAGSDSSGGAGIQGDLKTIAALGYHGLSVITAITAQNTTDILSIEKVQSVDSQLKALEDDILIDSVKIGMIYDGETVKQIAEFLVGQSVNVVYDPVMVASTGKMLVSDQALEMIQGLLLPKVTLLTPNLSEGAYLWGEEIKTVEDMEQAAQMISDLYGCAVLVKGGHLEGEPVDVLYDHNIITLFRKKKVQADHTHGTGCCLSTAIACFLAEGASMVEAVRKGKGIVTAAIEHGYSIGKGKGPVDPLLYRVKD